MSELYPCPFCGAAARLVHNDGFWWCECQNEDDCSAVHPVYSRAETAVAQWNRRVPAQGVPVVDVWEAFEVIAEDSYNDRAIDIVRRYLESQAQPQPDMPEIVRFALEDYADRVDDDERAVILKWLDAQQPGQEVSE